MLSFNNFLKLVMVFLYRKTTYASIFFSISVLFSPLSANALNGVDIDLKKKTPSRHSLDLEKSCASKIDRIFANAAQFQKFLAPASHIYDEYNNDYILKAFKHKYVILYFWGSWCGQCLEDLKSLDRLRADIIFKEIDDLEIIPISVDFKDLQQIKHEKRLSELKNLVLFTDKKKELYSQLRVTNIPTTFILNPKHEVIFGFQGSLKFDCPVIYEKLKQLDTANLEVTN